jgi:hypothetical protein
VRGFSSPFLRSIVVLRPCHEIVLSPSPFLSITSSSSLIPSYPHPFLSPSSHLPSITLFLASSLLPYPSLSLNWRVGTPRHRETSRPTVRSSTPQRYGTMRYVQCSVRTLHYLSSSLLHVAIGHDYMNTSLVTTQPIPPQLKHPLVPGGPL